MSRKGESWVSRKGNPGCLGRGESWMSRKGGILDV